MPDKITVVNRPHLLATDAFSWQLLGDFPHSLYIPPRTIRQVLCNVRVCKYFSQSTLFGCLLVSYYTQ